MNRSKNATSFHAHYDLKKKRPKTLSICRIKKADHSIVLIGTLADELLKAVNSGSRRSDCKTGNYSWGLWDNCDRLKFGFDVI